MKRILAYAISALTFASLACADATLHFDAALASQGQTGTITYNGSTITGTNIKLLDMSVSGTLADGTYFLQNAFLNFTTGTQTSANMKFSNTTGGVSGGTTNQLTFGPGGSAVITGNIYKVGTSGPFMNGTTTLVSGIFDDGTSYLPALGAQGSVGGSGPTNVDSSIVTFLGFLPITTTWNFELTANDGNAIYKDGSGNSSATKTKPGKGTAVKSFTSGSTGGDLNAVTDADPVPEPASIVLFSGVLIGVGRMLRRRKTA